MPGKDCTYTLDGKKLSYDEFRRELQTDDALWAKYVGARRTPDMPFKRSEEWGKLALRRLVDEAVEGGYDRISWTTGEQQASRFDLSQHVKWIDWSVRDEGVAGRDRYVVIEAMPIGAGETRADYVDALVRHVVTVDELANVIGKELARKVKDAVVAGQRGSRFEGQDLVAGGHGMRRFYDEMIPKFVK